jgi:hypothetical protein
MRECPAPLTVLETLGLRTALPDPHAGTVVLAAYQADFSPGIGLGRWLTLHASSKVLARAKMVSANKHRRLYTRAQRLRSKGI